MQRMHAVYFFHLGLSIGDLVIAHFVLFAAFYWKNDRNHTLRVWIWGIFTILTWSILLLDILRVFGIGGAELIGIVIDIAVGVSSTAPPAYELAKLWQVFGYVLDPPPYKMTMKFLNPFFHVIKIVIAFCIIIKSLRQIGCTVVLAISAVEYVTLAVWGTVPAFKVNSPSTRWSLVLFQTATYILAAALAGTWAGLGWHRFRENSSNFLMINLVFMTTITARWYLLKLARLRKITELPRPGLSGNWHAHHGPRPSQGGLRRQDSDEELIVRPRPTLRANVYRSIGTL